MELKEENYPLNCKEFEEKVISFFLETFEKDKRDKVEDELDELLKEDPYFISSYYSQLCFYYDNPKKYGENAKNVFEDDSIRALIVPQLRFEW